MNADPFGASLEDVIGLAKRLVGNLPKPMVSWIFGPVPHHVVELARQLECLGFPVYSDPETAVKSLGVICKYASVL